MITIQDFLTTCSEPQVKIKYDFVCDFELETVTAANRENVIKSGGDIKIIEFEIDPSDDIIIAYTEPITAND